MKNLFIKLLSLTLALLMIFAFTACKDEKDDSKDDETPDTNNETPDKDDWFKPDEEDPGEEDEDPIDDEYEFVYDGIWWLTGRGAGFFQQTLKEDGNEFHVKSDSSGKTWKWLVRAGKFDNDSISELALEEGTIEAVFTTGANMGIVFGGKGLEIPKDGGTNVMGSQGVNFYYLCYKNDGTVTLYNDAGDETTPTTVQKVTITDVIPTFDIASNEITLKVEFTKDGSIKAYVNGTEIISESGLVPYGTQFGMMVDDGTGFEVSAQVVTLKSFTYTPAGAEA